MLSSGFRGGCVALLFLMFSNVPWELLDFSLNVPGIFSSEAASDSCSEKDIPLVDDFGGRKPESVVRNRSYCGISLPDSIENSRTFEIGG